MTILTSLMVLDCLHFLQIIHIKWYPWSPPFTILSIRNGIEYGVIQAYTGGETTVQLAAAPTNVSSTNHSTNDYYNNWLIFIYDGNGAGQTKVITDYVGETTTATINSAFASTVPNSSSKYRIFQFQYGSVNINSTTAPALDHSSPFVDGVVSSATETSKGSGNVGEDIDITDVVASDVGAYLAIKITPGDPDADRF